MHENDYAAAARALTGAKHAFALTGAGCSVESGIPDFRSAGGIWAKYPPERYATIDAFLADPARVCEMWRELGAGLAAAQPNPAHIALARLDVSAVELGGTVEIGKLDGHQKRIKATQVKTSHYDPTKARVRA